MAKYRELPRQPKTVHAIQYVGMENGVPLWNEEPTAWVLAAFAKGRLAVRDGGLYCQGKSMDLGSWLLIDESARVDDIWWLSGPEFLSSYTVARKKPGPRKPRTPKVTTYHAGFISAPYPSGAL
jgi:hypothetical protein